MVNARSQARSSIPVFMGKTSRNDRVSDSESECSIPDLLTKDQIDELDNENLIHSEQHSDQMTIDQRFSSMNRQLNELTGLLLALTESYPPVTEKGTIKIQLSIRLMHVPTGRFHENTCFRTSICSLLKRNIVR